MSTHDQSTIRMRTSKLLYRKETLELSGLVSHGSRQTTLLVMSFKWIAGEVKKEKNQGIHRKQKVQKVYGSSRYIQEGT